MSVSYERWAVVLAYRVDHGNDGAPSEQQLVDYDRSQKETYADAIIAAARKAGLPVDPYTVGMLLILTVSSAGDTAVQKARAAAKYFADTNPNIPHDARAIAMYANPGS